MFEIYDGERGELWRVRAGHEGELRVYVAAAVADPGVDGWRAGVLADLVGRVAEHHHLRVSTAAGVAQNEAWEALNVHPLVAAPEMPQPLDVAIVPAAGDVAAACLVRPGPVTGEGIGLGAVRAGGLDPLALRLTFLDQHYQQPLELSMAGLAASDAELRQWREQVAQWANSPSKPMCAQYLRDALTALDHDLGSGAALATMRALAADSEIPAGAKFETFAYLDRLLGLDLAREVGRA